VPIRYVLARITFKPEAAATAREPLADLADLAELAARARRKDGRVRYGVFQQAGAARVFQTVEEWRGAASADAHMESPHVAAAFAAAGPWLAGPPQISSYSRLG
jgi:quinol monooxygenase YgiN